MLHDFLTSNRNELIIRCKAKVAKRSPRVAAPDNHGVPLFLSQLAHTLYRAEYTTTHRADPLCRGHSPTPPRATKTASAPDPSEIGRAAALHGAELLRSGYSVDQ